MTFIQIRKQTMNEAIHVEKKKESLPWDAIYIPIAIFHKNIYFGIGNLRRKQNDTSTKLQIIKLMQDGGFSVKKTKVSKRVRLINSYIEWELSKTYLN